MNGVSPNRRGAETIPDDFSMTSSEPSKREFRHFCMSLFSDDQRLKELAVKRVGEWLTLHPEDIKVVPERFKHMCLDRENMPRFWKPEQAPPDVREEFQCLLRKIDSGHILGPAEREQLDRLVSEVPEWGYHNEAIWAFRRLRI